MEKGKKFEEIPNSELGAIGLIVDSGATPRKVNTAGLAHRTQGVTVKREVEETSSTSNILRRTIRYDRQQTIQ